MIADGGSAELAGFAANDSITIAATDATPERQSPLHRIVLVMSAAIPDEALTLGISIVHRLDGRIQLRTRPVAKQPEAGIVAAPEVV